MRKSSKRLILILGGVAAAILAVPVGIWLTLSHEPTFYRVLVSIPIEQREEAAKNFVSRSLQLRNDVVNEPAWEAVFSDQEINSWLAEELMKHFSRQIPKEVHEPRVVFEPERIKVAFQLDQGPVRSVVWVVLRARVPEDNVLALTLEKIRAGALPIPADRVIDKVNQQVRSSGLDIEWKQEEGLPVAFIRYRADRGLPDIVLERVELADGAIRIAGRSYDKDTAKVATPVLPSRRDLDRHFPNRNRQATAVEGEPPPPEVAPNSSTAPTS